MPAHPCSLRTKAKTTPSNAINGTNVFVIHAQTPKFSIRDGTCNGVDPVTPPDESSCVPVTVTETATSTVIVSATCSLLPPSPEESATDIPASATATVVVVPSLEPSAPSASDATPTESENAAKPTVTSPPVVGGVQDGSDEDGITSTVYSTVYKDLSEVEDCAHLCSA
jgi:hypothetical protein